MTIFLSIVFGVFFLWLGAELLVRSGASLSLRFGLPIIVIGLTVMGYGTGTPELVVSIQASLLGKGDIAIGNVIGSNIANSALILGFSALCRPIAIKSKLIKWDIPFMVVVSAIFSLLLFFTSLIGRGVGILFLVGLGAYTYHSIVEGKKDRQLVQEEKEEIEHFRMKYFWLELVLLLAGFVVLFIGGRFFLGGALALAKSYHISDAVIGVTLIALGTSLPELAVSIIAAVRKHGDVSIGNVIGSNIFNILAIVGVVAIINPIEIKEITLFQYLYMLGLAVLMWIMARSRYRISRIEGALLLSSYVLFIAYMGFSVT